MGEPPDPPPHRLLDPPSANEKKMPPKIPTTAYLTPSTKA